MTLFRCIVLAFAALLAACASTPEAPTAGQSLATGGGYTPTGNPVLDAAMQASAQAAQKSATQAAVDQLQNTGLSAAQSQALAQAAAGGDLKAARDAAAAAALDEGKREAKQQASAALGNALGGALGGIPGGGLLGQSLANSVADQAVDATAGQVSDAAGLTTPGAVDPTTGLAAPYDPTAGAVAAAAASGSEAPYAAGTLPPGTVGVLFNGQPLVPAVQSGDVKIECFYSNFPPDRGFIPMEVKVTPLARLDALTIKVDPEDGVVMRDGPLHRAITTPADPYFRRIFAMRATDRDSYLRVSTVSKTSTSESKRSVLCPLARIDKVPDTSGF